MSRVRKPARMAAWPPDAPDIEPPGGTGEPGTGEPAAPPAREFVVERNKTVRQAGAAASDTAWIAALRARAEQSLYVFAKSILDYHFLKPTIHKPIADWLQSCPPRRKLLLMPRDHGKTTLGPRSIPLHMWIQPAESNLYFPGERGVTTRILLAGETEGMAKGNLRVVRTHLESNELLRALWPHVVWDNPRRQAKVWNDTDIIIPRGDAEFAECSMECVGVGGAKTGKHPNVIFKDDITTEAAANSDVMMQTAIDWHINTRALFSHPETDLEFITGTYWATYDLPHYIERNDPSVEHSPAAWRAIVNADGEPWWPEKFSRETVAQLQREYGPRFYLLYMNSDSDSGLVDFDRGEIRLFEMADGVFTYAEDERDALAWSPADWLDAPPMSDAPNFRGKSLSDASIQEQLRARAFRARAI